MRLLFGIILGISFSYNCQVPIGGTINSYTVPISYDNCTNTAIVSSSTGITANSFALIIQMQGAQIDVSNTATSGSVQDIKKTGLFEIAQIQSVNGNAITFVSNLVNQYDFTGIVQLVVCPNYTDVVVNSTITAPSWNGSTGGVVFLKANSITLNASIESSSNGFRGGLSSSNYYSSSTCGNMNYITTNLLGAQKGESIALNPATFGRGCFANGGGGGNSVNAGGGGGGNAGTGGRGGNQWTGCTVVSNGGIGGASLNYNNRIFLGGGGGGAQQNDGTATIGARGGGIVVIKSNSIVSNNASIRSNGEAVNLYSHVDGAGGGGAGGSLIIESTSISGNLTLESKGGNGGSLDNNFLGSNGTGGCHGPGGGGGGGKIILNAPLSPSITTSISGGLGGLNTNPQSSCYNQNFGSENGEVGIVILNGNPIPIGNEVPSADWDITAQIVQGNCSGISSGSITIDVSPQYNYQYNWSHDSQLTGNVATNLVPGVYSVQISLNGCSRDTSFTLASVDGIISCTLSVQDESCTQLGSISVLNVSGGMQPFQYSLDNQSFNSSSILQNLLPGNYTVYIKDNNGCLYDTLITILPKNEIEISWAVDQDCAQNLFTVTFDATFNTPAQHTYTFNGTTSTTGVFQQVSPNTYPLHISNNLGCVKDTLVTILSVQSVDSISIVTFDEFCSQNNGSFIVTNMYGDVSSSYLIFNADTIFTHEIHGGLDTGNYYLSIVDSYGCVYDTTFQIDESFQNPFEVIMDVSNGSCGVPSEINVLDVYGGYAPYSYSINGSTYTSTPSYYFYTPGSNILRVKDSVGCVFDYPFTITQQFEIELLTVPNCFTPDNDQINDTWFVNGTCLTEFSCSIFNRWGQVLFHYTNINEEWDGKYLGVMCPDGVYTYLIEVGYISGKKEILNGHITLIR